MNKVLKKALGFAGALGLTAVMVLAAAPVQASDVDARIQVLERELVQLKQNQESALAAEMKGPSFKYSAGRGLTIAAADNNWSITFGQRLQIYTSMYLTNDDPEGGYQNGVIRIRRFRPNINVTSQQGFLRSEVAVQRQYWRGLRRRRVPPLREDESFSPHCGLRLQPRLQRQQEPGFWPDRGFAAPQRVGNGRLRRTAAWCCLGRNFLPWGSARSITLNLAMGLDQAGRVRAHGPGPRSDGRSMAFGLGIQPLAKAKGMGGFNVSSLKYSFRYESMTRSQRGSRFDLRCDDSGAHKHRGELPPKVDG